MPCRHIGGADVRLHSFLTSVVDGGGWSTAHLGCFTPGEKSQHYPLYRLCGSWILSVLMEKRKALGPVLGFDLRIVQPVS